MLIVTLAGRGRFAMPLPSILLDETLEAILSPMVHGFRIAT
jgi:hypothetical protein